MGDNNVPDWNFIIDFRFMEIEAEPSVILDHLEALDQRLPAIQRSERDRLERELADLEPEERYGMVQWIDEFVDEVLPRLYYSPVLVQLWATFESGIIEISKYIQKKEGYLLVVNDLRGNSDYERAQKYRGDQTGETRKITKVGKGKRRRRNWFILRQFPNRVCKKKWDAM